MGGEREATIPMRDQEGGMIGTVRFHESKGEVHFHDDVNGLKVAVPSGTWYAAWQKLAAEGGSWRYVDAAKQAAVFVESWLNKRKVLRCTVEVQPILEISDEYAALQKFTEGAK
jgi:hypothetical protein